MVKVKEDLTGRTFGKWLVIKQVEDGKNHSAKYLCQCTCQAKTERIVLARSLKKRSFSIVRLCSKNKINRRKIWQSNSGRQKRKLWA